MGSALQPVPEGWTKGAVGLRFYSPSPGFDSCFQRWVGRATRSTWTLDASLHLHTSASSPTVSASLRLPVGSCWKSRSSQLVPAAPQSYSAWCMGEQFATQQVVAPGHLPTNSLLLVPYYTRKFQLLPLIKQARSYFLLL